MELTQKNLAKNFKIRELDLYQAVQKLVLGIGSKRLK